MRKPKHYTVDSYGQLLFSGNAFHKKNVKSCSSAFYFIYFIFLAPKKCCFWCPGQMMRNSLWHTGNTDRQVNQELLFSELKDRDDIPLLLEVKRSFKLVWMKSASPCNSLIGYSLKCRCCSLVWSISLLTKTSFDPKIGIINVLNIQIQTLAGICSYVRYTLDFLDPFSMQILQFPIATDYTECQASSTVVRIGSPAFSPAREAVPSPFGSNGGGGWSHSLTVEGAEANSGRTDRHSGTQGIV